MVRPGRPRDADSAPWQEAFARHSEPHWDALLRFAVSLCRSRPDAEDLVQSSLLRGMKYFKSFGVRHLNVQNASDVDSALADPERARHFKNWLYQIVRHVFYDERELAGRLPLSDLPDESGPGNEASGVTFGNHTPSPGPEEFLSTAGTPGFNGQEPGAADVLALAQERFFTLAADDEMRRELEALSERQRSVLYLISEEYSYKEVAKILSVPIGTVMSTLSRALQKLKARRPAASPPPVDSGSIQGEGRAPSESGPASEAPSVHRIPTRTKEKSGRGSERE